MAKKQETDKKEEEQGVEQESLEEKRSAAAKAKTTQKEIDITKAALMGEGEEKSDYERMKEDYAADASMLELDKITPLNDQDFLKETVERMVKHNQLPEGSTIDSLTAEQYVQVITESQAIVYDWLTQSNDRLAKRHRDVLKKHQSEFDEIEEEFEGGIQEKRESAERVIATMENEGFGDNKVVEQQLADSIMVLEEQKKDKLAPLRQIVGKEKAQATKQYKRWEGDIKKDVANGATFVRHEDGSPEMDILEDSEVTKTRIKKIETKLKGQPTDPIESPLFLTSKKNIEVDGWSTNAGLSVLEKHYLKKKVLSEDLFYASDRIRDAIANLNFRTRDYQEFVENIFANENRASAKILSIGMMEGAMGRIEQGKKALDRKNFGDHEMFRQLINFLKEEPKLDKKQRGFYEEHDVDERFIDTAEKFILAEKHNPSEASLAFKAVETLAQVREPQLSAAEDEKMSQKTLSMMNSLINQELTIRKKRMIFGPRKIRPGTEAISLIINNLLTNDDAKEIFEKCFLGQAFSDSTKDNMQIIKSISRQIMGLIDSENPFDPKNDEVFELTKKFREGQSSALKYLTESPKRQEKIDQAISYAQRLAGGEYSYGIHSGLDYMKTAADLVDIDVEEIIKLAGADFDPKDTAALEEKRLIYCLRDMVPDEDEWSFNTPAYINIDNCLEIEENPKNLQEMANKLGLEIDINEKAHEALKELLHEVGEGSISTLWDSAQYRIEKIDKIIKTFSVPSSKIDSLKDEVGFGDLALDDRQDLSERIITYRIGENQLKDAAKAAKHSGLERSYIKEHYPRIVSYLDKAE